MDMNRTALITGSSRGIGRATAARLALDGYAVCINYLEQKEKAEELVSALKSAGCSAMAMQADVSDREQVNAMVKQATDAFGPINVLVNNAATDDETGALLEFTRTGQC